MAGLVGCPAWSLQHGTDLSFQKAGSLRRDHPLNHHQWVVYKLYAQMDPNGWFMIVLSCSYPKVFWAIRQEDIRGLYEFNRWARAAPIHMCFSEIKKGSSIQPGSELQLLLFGV